MKILKRRKKEPKAGVRLWRLNAVLLVLIALTVMLPSQSRARYIATASGTSSTSIAAFDVRITPQQFSGSSTTVTTTDSYKDYSFVVENRSKVAIQVRAVIDSGVATPTPGSWVAVGIGQSTTITVRVPGKVSVGNTASIRFEYEQTD